MTLPSQNDFPISKARAPRRLLSVRPQKQYEALQAARKRQATKEFSKHYALRSGIEATISPSAFAPLTCAGRAIVDSNALICNMWQRLQQFIWFV